MIKKQIRQEILEKRRKLKNIDHKNFSETITSSVLNSSYYKNANTIMTFISFSDEVNTHDFIRKAISDGKRVTVPITFPKTREIKASHILDFGELELGYYNILTPKKEFIRFIPPEEIDLIIVPGVAFDKNGYRVGYGGGYYDRFLSNLPNVVTIGIAFELQMIDEVPKDKFDIPVNFIFTEKKVINCQ
ncbi:MAG: 5-formyltetrahydrofolate cyclo-ligase [Tissierellaceae bacterium]